MARSRRLVALTVHAGDAPSHKAREPHSPEAFWEPSLLSVVPETAALCPKYWTYGSLVGHNALVDVSRPYRIFESGVDAEVLRVLGGTHAPMNGREVARLVRSGSRMTALRSLTRLAELGVVDVAEAGRALMYTLNRDHLAAPAIEMLVSMRRRMVDALVAEVVNLDPSPVSVTLFGSAARGDGDRQSDIDLLIVRGPGGSEDTWEAQIDALSRSVARMTGNSASVHDIGPDELDHLAREGASLIEEIEQDSVLLFGEPISELLRATRG